MLRYTATQAPDLLAAVERIAIDGEVEAVRTAIPTPGAADFLAACREVGRPVIVVSNNAAEAVRAYLDRHSLSEKVAEILGRPHARPDQMKPHPELVQRALAILDGPPYRCAMIGDSVTDIEVSRTTGIRAIGYAKTPQRGIELIRAGADAITEDMATLADAVRLIDRRFSG